MLCDLKLASEVSMNNAAYLFTYTIYKISITKVKIAIRYLSTLIVYHGILFQILRSPIGEGTEYQWHCYLFSFQEIYPQEMRRELCDTAYL